MSQSHEGCNLAGSFEVNKVSGNFHIAPGRSFARNNMHIHDTVSPFYHVAGFNVRLHHVSFSRSISINRMDLRSIIQVISFTISASALK